MTRLLTVAAILGGLVLAGLLAGPGGLWLGLTSAATPAQVGDLTKFDRAAHRTDHDSFFLAPTDMVKADANAPVFQLTLEDLQAAWKALMAAQPRLTQVGTSLNGMQIDYVQRSGVLRAPDLITVRFIPLRSDPATISFSTLAVYSRALTGLTGAGSNAARVRAWLGQIPGGLEQ